MGALHSLPPTLSDIWEQFRADVEDQADEYEADGWTTEIFIVGEVRPVADDDAVPGPGLRALVPDDQFEGFAALVREGEEYTCEIYRRLLREEVVFLLLVYEFDTASRVFFVPLFYRIGKADAMIERAREEGRLVTQLRTLDESGTLSLEHPDPSLFFPDPD